MKTVKENLTKHKYLESDLEIFGDSDMFKLLNKTKSLTGVFEKSTSAFEIDKVGCIVKVTTQYEDNIAEAITYVPFTKIEELKDEDDKIIGRKLIPMQ